MKNKFKLLQKLDKNSLDLFKHIGLSSVYKAGSILIGIILVPLSINYLGNEQYGLWLAIFSTLIWFNIIDFGIGNGLRNKLTEAITNNDTKLARSYISTAYFSITFISVIAFFVFFFVFPLVDWHTVFNFDISNTSVRKLIFVAFMMFAFNLTLKNINVIFYALQKSSYPELFSFIGQVVTLITILIAMKVADESLLLYGIIILGSQMLILFISTIIAFVGEFKMLSPSINYFNMNLVKDILNVGGKFLIIQISATLLFATDNFIINYVLGASEVTVYNIPHKYFMLVMTIMTIISTPYWSAFTKAYTENDYVWLKKSIKMLQKVGIALGLLAVIMITVSMYVYKLWVGDLVQVPFLLTLFMGLYTILRIYTYPKIMFLNGTGKVQIELYLGFFLSVINIPLSVFLAKNMGLGVSGVILSTFMVGIVEFLVYPLQVRKILNKTASGIWNK